jgi:hypothetical protein
MSSDTPRVAPCGIELALTPRGGSTPSGSPARHDGAALALTIVLAGLATAIVIVTLAIAFQRFDHESAYQRADGFISRVMAMHGDLLDQHQRQPAQFEDFLRSLLLYDPDSQLYLLAPDGTVLARSGKAPLPPGYRVAMEPVRRRPRPRPWATAAVPPT